jgi:hypothetical protein
LPCEGCPCKNLSLYHCTDSGKSPAIIRRKCKYVKMYSNQAQAACAGE